MSDTKADKLFGTILLSMDQKLKAQVESLHYIISQENRPIPESFDGRVVWKDYLCPIYDQGKSNACYAFASVSALADKFALQTMKQVKPLFNPLVIPCCMYDPELLDSLANYKRARTDEQYLQEAEKKHLTRLNQGNTLYSVARYLYRWGATENSCVSESLLQGAMQQKGQLPLCSVIQGPGEDECTDREHAGRVWPIINFFLLAGEGEELIRTMKLTIMKWGPLTAAFKVYPDFIDS